MGAPAGSFLVNDVTAVATNTEPTEDEEVTLVVTSSPPAPAISKTDHQDPLMPGALLIYTIQVVNASAFTVTNATVVDEFSPCGLP